MIDIDTKAIRARVQRDLYGDMEPYRLLQTVDQYQQNIESNVEKLKPVEIDRTPVEAKFEGDWFTPVFRQNLATSWLESKFKYAPLLLQGGDGNAPIIDRKSVV